VATDEALILGSVRRHKLTEAAEKLNVRLRAENAQRHRAGEYLCEGGERFRGSFASASMAVFACDHNDVIQPYTPKLIHLGLKHILSKPFTTADLLKMVQEALTVDLRKESN